MFRKRIWHGRMKARALLVLGLVALALVLLATPGHAALTWSASYWNNTNLAGPPDLQRLELGAPYFNWGEGSPVPGLIRADQFSARWQSAPFLDPGRYRFTVTTDDGVRLWVGESLLIDEWHDNAGATFTAEMDVTTGASRPIILDYYENGGNALIQLTWRRVGDVASLGTIRAEYFNNMNLEGPAALTRNETDPIQHNWGQGSPAPGLIASDHFSARFTRTMNLEPGRYRFTTRADDGLRLWIDGQLVIDQWFDAPATTNIVELNLNGGTTHFVAAYYENVGQAEVSIIGHRIDETAPSPYPGPGNGTGGVIPPGGGLTATVTASYLNLRAGPGIEFQSVTVLRGDTILELTGAQQGSWVQVRTPEGITGWVNEQYLEYNFAFPAGG